MNYFITYCDYPKDHNKYILYSKYTKPRFIDYCKIHDLKFVEITRNCAFPYNLGFAKVFWIKNMLPELSDGDTVTYMDIDCCIMDGRIAPFFEKDVAVVVETTGCLCMGGTWGIRISDWTRKFINEICSDELQKEYAGSQSWTTWHENDAIYKILGMNWGCGYNMIGTIGTSPFTQQELLNHVEFLPSSWGATYEKDDVDWSKNNYDLNDQNDPNWIYKIVKQYIRPELECNFENIIVRHLSAGTMQLEWANKYYETKMKL